MFIFYIPFTGDTSTHRGELVKKGTVKK